MDPIAAPTGAGATRARSRTPRRDPSPELASVSIIVPTYNEAANVEIVLDRIAEAMAADPAPYEIVVVDDDSADGTWLLAERRAAADPRIRVVRRTDQRGLSSAVLSGMAVATGTVLVVIDADLQHDERRIPDLVAGVLAGADVCIGSREAEGGGYGDFGRRRLLASRLGAALARAMIGVAVTDPMSGFFAVSRDRYRELSGQLNPRGFKILLEFLARGSAPAVSEVGYVFGTRLNGATKLNGPVVGAYLLGLVELTLASRWTRRRAGHRGPERGRRPSQGINRRDR